MTDFTQEEYELESGTYMVLDRFDRYIGLMTNSTLYYVNTTRTSDEPDRLIKNLIWVKNPDTGSRSVII